MKFIKENLTMENLKKAVLMLALSDSEYACNEAYETSTTDFVKLEEAA